MGQGSYTANDWVKLKNSKGLIKNNSVSHIFNSNSFSSKYDVKNIKYREAFDPDSSSFSTPIIIGFDVTASMGYLAKELAVNGINKVVSDILRYEVVSSPQIMCSAIGDCKSDKCPLQVTQFESDIRIIHQLTELYLEGGGGGNDAESYNLLWYFAANHTKTDCYDKRRKKGYLFTIGDDKCHQDLSRLEIQNVFSDNVSYPISNEQLLRQVMMRYHVFHINIQTDLDNSQNVYLDWQKVLPKFTTQINIKDIEYLSDLIVSMIILTNGKDANSVLKTLDQDVAERIARSLSLLDFNHEISENKISF